MRQGRCFTREIRPFVVSLVTVLSILAVVGCGGTQRPSLAPVTGRVLFLGKPAVGATVTFIRDGAARHSYGVTDEKGDFTLTTYEPNDGAILGTNTITVVLAAKPGGDASSQPIPDAESYFRDLRASQSSSRDVLPERYAKVDTTDLSATVKTGGNHFELILDPDR